MKPVISIWGDSIGKGVTFDSERDRPVICKSSCEFYLKEKGYEVRNYARIGCTAPQGETLMTDERLQKGGVAVIEFGGNDSDIDWSAVDREPEKPLHPAKVSIPEFREALLRMARRAEAAGMRPVLTTPVPVLAQRYLDFLGRTRNRENLLRYLGGADYIYRWQERYDIAVREAASRCGAYLLDLRERFLWEKRLEDVMSADGIHPNARGHKLICEAAEKALAMA